MVRFNPDFYLSKLHCQFIKEDELFHCCNHAGKGGASGTGPYIPLKQNIIACHDMSLTDFDEYTKIIELTNFF